MAQVSGLCFRYDPAAAKGRRVGSVELTGGKWDDAIEYVVATNAMLAAGGHNYKTLTEGRGRAEHGSQYDMIRAWFKKNSPVNTPKPGRIVEEQRPKR